MHIYRLNKLKIYKSLWTKFCLGEKFMEQKGLDEINESFLGEEILDEEVVLDPKVKKPAKSKAAETKKKVAAKKAAPKKTTTKMETKPEPIPEVQIVQEEKKPAKITVNDVQEKKVEKTSEIKIESATAKQAPVNPWEEEENTGFFKEASTWKALTGILIILLIFSVFTGGFSLSDSTGAAVGVPSETISLNEAEQKALSYVNSELLVPPFVAEIESSQELDSLYQVTLLVAGQSVDSYITKNGELFFPQGFPTNDVNSAPTELQEPVAAIEPSIDDDPMKGDVTAPITIIEFSDFECGFCGQFFTETLPEIQEKYIDTGKVRLVYRDFPLEIHPNAHSASLAAQCANDQGKFWEYHDALFENQAALSEDLYVSLATTLGLDASEFSECLATEKHADEVNADFTDGTALGVTGTPAFFVNGKAISGAQPFSVFEAEIEGILAAMETSEPVIEVVEEASEPIVEEVVAPVVEEPVVTTQVVEVDMSARKWLFNPRKITVNQGDTLRLTITPQGLDFTFALPALGISQEVSGTTTIDIEANDAGTFDFSCSSCEEWRGMEGQLVVE